MKVLLLSILLFSSTTFAHSVREPVNEVDLQRLQELAVNREYLQRVDRESGSEDLGQESNFVKNNLRGAHSQHT